MSTSHELRQIRYNRFYNDEPESLLLLCARKIINNKIPLNQIRLPREVGQLLARQFRSLMRNQENLETEACEKFFTQFKPEYISLSEIDFSDLPIVDKFLVKFLRRYRSTLEEINIDNCNKLTRFSFEKFNEMFSGKDLNLLRRKPRSHNYNNQTSNESTTQQQNRYEHIYVGNGQVNRVPANTSRSFLENSKPMSYITNFGRLENGIDLDFDYDRYDFNRDVNKCNADNNLGDESEYIERNNINDQDNIDKDLEVVRSSHVYNVDSDSDDDDDDDVDVDDFDDDDQVVESMKKRLCLQPTTNSKSSVNSACANKSDKDLFSYCSRTSPFVSRIALPTYDARAYQGKNNISACSSISKNYPVGHSTTPNILRSRGTSHNFHNNDKLPEQLATKRNTPNNPNAKSARTPDDSHVSSTTNLKTLVIGETISKILPGHPDLINAAFSSSLALKKLVAHKLIDERFFNGGIISRLITPAMNSSLQFLDLSNSSLEEASFLTRLDSLKVLILFNCDMTYPQVVNNICKLKSLEVLDISTVKQADRAKEDSEGALKLIIRSLPKLTSLDISGTQLVSRKDPELSGLSIRQNNPFEFLGLLNTEENASYISNIPATTIAGDANESQILTSCEVYIKRPEQLRKALHELFLISRSKAKFDEIRRANYVVLDAMHNHIHNENVQIAATASLFCICRSNEVKINFSLKINRLIVSRLLDTMHRHKQCKQILLNGSLILINLIVNFKTQAWINECYRLASIALYIIDAKYNDEGVMQRHGVAILNSLACQVGGEQKILMADLEAIVHMIKLIKVKLTENRCDEVLEAAWSTMWNITDESPINCRKFLNEQGLEIFEQCMDKFPGSKDLTRNMMGLLGNVAECADLRQHFMQKRFIKKFTNLLSSDKIECSYNACGLLAHLMSEGSVFWNMYLPNHLWQYALKKMKNAISTWKICEARSINYRSFVPIIKLLEPGLAPEVQYWAVWALTNLTRVYPGKYCSRLFMDGGYECLNRLIRSDTAPYVRDLACITMYQCEWFEKSIDGTLNGLESCDSIDMQFIEKFMFDPGFRALNLSDINLIRNGRHGPLLEDFDDEDSD